MKHFILNIFLSLILFFTTDVIAQPPENAPKKWPCDQHQRSAPKPIAMRGACSDPSTKIRGFKGDLNWGNMNQSSSSSSEISS